MRGRPLDRNCLAWDRVRFSGRVRELVCTFRSDDYRWEIGKINATKGPASVTYLIGELISPMEGAHR